MAIGNTLIRIARPLATIAVESNAARFAAIAALIDDWQPGLLIVGRPLHADGTTHEMTALAERFARQLEGRFGLPVARVDERYTSVDADAVLAAAGVRGPSIVKTSHLKPTCWQSRRQTKQAAIVYEIEQQSSRSTRSWIRNRRFCHRHGRAAVESRPRTSPLFSPSRVHDNCDCDAVASPRFNRIVTPQFNSAASC